jgi:hypothetical protein
MLTARRRIGFLLALATLAASGCVGTGSSPLAGNLLGEPSEKAGVAHLARLTDGLTSNEGDHWLTGLTARIDSPRAFVQWDLGAAKPLRCALVQGDNNDSYHVLGSNDGEDFVLLWSAQPVGGAGMRLRTGTLPANTTMRYVRLTASGGDGLYSVGEIAVYSQCPAEWPNVQIARAEGLPIGEGIRLKLWLFAAAAIGFIFLTRRGGPRRQYLLALVPLGLGVSAAFSLSEIYPFFDEEPVLRAVVAAIAGALVIKEAFFPERLAPHPKVSLTILGVLAVTALGCYYHFASAQFFDAAKGRRTFVHTFDMRHYFPTAKYFRELRFDGLYLGSLAAYLDNTGASVESVRTSRLRDLTTYDMITAEQAAPKLAEIRARFTPARWQEFKRDMKYFLDTMGPGDYLGSMQDHGGNATPVWLLGAWALFRSAPASELSLSLAGFIDVGLVLLLLVVVYRTFGVRVMLYVAIIFGATDFYQFGSNLMGSTLRQDWLVALGLGACALKVGRSFLGGFLLAYAGLIRAFPALAAMFLVVPLGWWIFGYWRANGRLPRWATLRAEQRPALRAIAGAATSVISLIAVTSALFGLQGAWGTWLKKIAIHATGPSVNNVGLRNVLAWRPWHSAAQLIRNDQPEPWVLWQRYQVSNFAQLRPLFYLLNLAAVALAVLACRRRPLHQAALIGLLLIPFFFYPSNYYCHYIFLLPLAVAGDGSPRERNFGWVVTVLAAMCVGQYATLFEGWTDLRYTYQSFVLLAGSAAILIPLAWQEYRFLRPRAVPVPAAAPEPQPVAEPEPAAPEPSPDPAAVT